MDIRKIKQRVRDRCLIHRSLARLVESPQFHEAWLLANEDQQQEVVVCFNNEDLAAVMKWIRRVGSKDEFESMTVQELRTKARAAGIDYYHHMPKHQLIESLRKRGT